MKKSSSTAGLENLVVAQALGSHGRADMTLWTGSKFADAASGEEITIAIGPADDETLVLTGQITARRQTRDGIILRKSNMARSVGKIVELSINTAGR